MSCLLPESLITCRPGVKPPAGSLVKDLDDYFSSSNASPPAGSSAEACDVLTTSFFVACELVANVKDNVTTAAPAIRRIILVFIKIKDEVCY